VSGIRCYLSLRKDIGEFAPAHHVFRDSGLLDEGACIPGMPQKLLKFESGGSALVVLYDRCLSQGASPPARTRHETRVSHSRSVAPSRFPSQRHLPLVDLLVDTQAELMELAVASGLKERPKASVD
jgi:hypothetical protein